jgi:hypothetical protein
MVPRLARGRYTHFGYRLRHVGGTVNAATYRNGRRARRHQIAHVLAPDTPSGLDVDFARNGVYHFPYGTQARQDQRVKRPLGSLAGHP